MNTDSDPFVCLFAVQRHFITIQAFIAKNGKLKLYAC